MITRSKALFSTDTLKVLNDVAKQRFLISMQGAEAVLQYEQSGNKIILHRTEVPEQFQGKGVGKVLAKHAFDHASSNELDVVCKCHFLAKFYENQRSYYKKLSVTFDLEDEN